MLTFPLEPNAYRTKLGRIPTADEARASGKFVAHVNTVVPLAKAIGCAMTFHNADLAYALGEDPSLVADVVFTWDCGSNGVTVSNGPLAR